MTEHVGPRAAWVGWTIAAFAVCMLLGMVTIVLLLSAAWVSFARDLNYVGAALLGLVGALGAWFLVAGLAFRREITVEREKDRRRRHCCPRCAYDLRASIGRCPECGWAISGDNVEV